MSPPPPIIDELLARYLLLLDQYTALRATLSARSSALFLGLARARFSAPRPVGPDSYDMRMQASRRVRVRPSSVPEQAEGGGVVFEVIPADGGQGAGGSGEEGKGEEGEGAKEGDRDSDARSSEDGQTEEEAEGEKDREDTPDDDETQSNNGSKGAKKPPSNDPLRWFGILTPAPLREAQREAVEVVEDVIPRLVSLDAEMAAIELAVRRARKKRGKAEKKGKVDAV